ncbi:hypothetical protein ACFWVC_07185 [Streptomyces sp. NPDC058691]|uniref:hypothetical protein n=1 Tax=Streptomyces sp. NPDC058691 TaxID=3346601 RepID=UPI00364F7B51
MICPHCEQSLLRKERPGNVCSKCGRTYALDPKTNPLRLSDLRIRRLVLRLTEEGKVPCVPGQLWYAASRKSLRGTKGSLGCAVMLALVGIVVGFVGLEAGLVPYRVIGGLSLLAAFGFVVARVRGVGRGRSRLSRDAFLSGPLREWRSVYGALPIGVIDESRYPFAPGAREEHRRAPGEPPSRGLVLVCPDRSIAVFLDAVGLTSRYGLTLATDPEQVSTPPGETGPRPVLVLHDADAHGLLLADLIRTALPGRWVIDIGLPLSAVDGPSRAVPMRGKRPAPHVMQALMESGRFSPRQLKWLRRGWGFPLVAVPPAKLLAVVARAVERAGAAVDPQWQRAAAAGFMTWPEESG